MKRWQAILMGTVLPLGAALAPQFTTDPEIQKIIQGAIAVTGAVVAKVVSENNPDGTSAKTAWIPEEKK